MFVILTLQAVKSSNGMHSIKYTPSQLDSNKNYTIYVLDNRSRYDYFQRAINGKAMDIFVSPNVVITQRLQKQDTVFNISNMASCPPTQDLIVANCFIKVEQNSTTNEQILAMISQFNQAVTTYNQFQVVYTSMTPDYVHSCTIGIFAVGSMSTTIIIFIMLGLYTLMAIWPALAVDVPMDLPTGEDE